ncbi:PIN domain nuclease, a component of toxin-antitoxin system (PIN domain) [Paramicrobacterium humi]|uniref:PIN domain nuclease, a component of toxin-antitoxin system (PIN domain) n=1 Tax=Paramicrobacterium humi TaxID=640635 RepID=A0A1H4P786_9MICO|nr:type II toxin-antitoxin system VapC family toxin [Microbacterium humi]SEC03296.1 PIN domain nuclease, a component of toxin-antitoxin system (PIN domain) [Microbacterium humi]
MRLLLDTNVVLWLLLGDRSRIPQAIVDRIEDTGNAVLVSAASVWEIAIKRSLGKLEIEDRWPRALNSLGFDHRPVTAEHAAAVEKLPWIHGDPFDRLLLAQAKLEGATVVTADERMRKYDVPSLWV